MRKTAFFACLSMFAAALAAQTSTTDTFANQSGRNLRIVLLPPSPKTHQPLRYRLSEPAYVAAFMVYPGSGVRLLYPQIDAPERLQPAGYNVESLLRMSFDNEAYKVVLGPVPGGPSYLYMIASRHPLNVARYVNRPMRLASAVGAEDRRSFYASVAFDALVNNAISLGDDQSWDADVYVVWPEAASDNGLAVRSERHQVRYTLIMCSDGIPRAVPYNYPFTSCAGDGRVRADRVALKPVAQKTAMAPAAAVAPVSRGVPPSLRGGSSLPTVLPTIIGKRAVDADRGGPPEQSGASRQVTYTMANGDQAAPAPVIKVAPGVQIEAMDGGYIDRRPSDRARMDGRANSRRPVPDRADANDRASDRGREAGQQGEVVGGSPQLSPNPKLAPNPGVTPAPAAAPAPHNEAHQRVAREPMRVQPAPGQTPRRVPPIAKP